MKYEKPDLEELELVLEGSFLDSRTKPETEVPDDVVDTDKGEGDFGGSDWD